MAIAEPDLVQQIDLLAADVGRQLDPRCRAEMGQFFTPAPIARLMADWLSPAADEVRILDPGAGIGSLTAAWVASVCEAGTPPRSIRLTAYEADSKLASYLRETVSQCEKLCDERGIDFKSEVFESDFISDAVESLAGRALLGKQTQGYTCAILNPPYCKLHSSSLARAQLRTVGIETSNLYTAFLWLAFRLLQADGQLVAITPRSFCNGPYFRPFREAFVRDMQFTRIHVYESRMAAFKDADVLQENVIFHAVKSREPRPALISSSTSPEDPDVCIRDVSAKDLINGPDSVIHIVPDEIGNRISERINGLTSTLADLRIQVSTGRVVEFRSKDALAFEPEPGAVPLIYPAHFNGGFVVWPKVDKKPNYLRARPDTESLLVPPGTYVLVKRFSAKEEKRRISAAICDPTRLPNVDYGFENHLNYFHRDGHGISESLAKGLTAYLNSTLVDTYFRLFSGHTQVNASDLRSLPYPDIVSLERIGSKIDGSLPDQDAIDAIISEELAMAGDDPVKNRKRLAEALSILAELGLPKAQQNERSALTLLALLDLTPNKKWKSASAPSKGVTPIMDWFAEHYGKKYAPNSRETVRRQTLHQFLEAGIIIQNPDDPLRPTNSGLNVYRIEAGALELLRTYGTKNWKKSLEAWLTTVETLKARYAKERKMTRIPLQLPTGQTFDLSPGGQNVLVKQIIDEFCPRFLRGGKPLYVGDAETKFTYFDEEALAALGVKIDAHGKMPDVVVEDIDRNWLVLIEAVTSHGPVDGKRHDELKRLFHDSTAGLVFVTAFLDRAAMVKYLSDIAWETEVWVAESPSHLIHFNGERFLGPYSV